MKTSLKINLIWSIAFTAIMIGLIKYHQDEIRSHEYFYEFLEARKWVSDHQVIFLLQRATPQAVADVNRIMQQDFDTWEYEKAKRDWPFILTPVVHYYGQLLITP